MEKARLVRRSKEVETALSEALWSGKATEAVTEKQTSSMRIAHGNEAAMEPLNASTSYGNLVRNDLMDFTERPKTVSSVPHYLLYDQKNLVPKTAVANKDYEAFGETEEVAMNASRNSRGTMSKGQVSFLPSSPISLGRGGESLPRLQVRQQPPSPQGRRSNHNRSDVTTVTSNSSWTQLDPVLYQERARTSWGREKKLGKVRVRNDPPGYKRAMLTSKGHPGIFHLDALEEEENMSKKLGNTII